MKKINIIRFFLALCIVISTVLLLMQIDRMGKRYTTVSMQLSSEVTKKHLLDAMEEEEEEKVCKINDITAFTQKEVTIEGRDLGRKAWLTSYCIYGRVEDALPVSLIAGNLLIKDDTYGCVLTKESAYMLFGSLDVIGVEVRMNEKNYTIRGIIDTNIEAILYESAQEYDGFDHIEFSIDDENGEFYANQFAQIYGLQVDYIIGENYLVKVLQDLGIIPFLFLTVSVSVLIAIKFRKTKIRHISIAAGIISIFIICWLMGYFPERWIPSKWSNFDHYSQITQNIKSQLHTLSFADPVAKEIALKSDLVKALSLFLISVVGQIYLIRMIYNGCIRIIDKYYEYTKLKQQNVEKIEEFDN